MAEMMKLGNQFFRFTYGYFYSRSFAVPKRGIPSR